MATNFSPSQAELALVSQIFLQADPQKLGIITGEVAVRVFGGAKLPPTVLGEIWSIADEENHGWLSKKGVAIAVRLMGWAQKGEKMTQALVNKPGPLPSIEGVTAVSRHNTGMSLPRSPPPGLPKLTAQDKAKFQRLFMGCGLVNGLLSGEKARDVFVKSKLPVDKLLQIWNLADTQDRGVLDSTDFAIGMYLIQASMSGQLSFIPTSLPLGLYEQAGGNPQVNIPSHATGTSGSFSPTLTGSFPQTRSALQQQYTGQSHSAQQNYAGTSPKPTSPRQPVRTAPSAFGNGAFGNSQGNGHVQSWDVTATEKASADRFFDGLDSQKKGYIEGDVAVPFMLESKLPGDDLAQVWDLADINNDGRLTRDGFAVAMHLIQGKLVGKEIPTTLPVSLIPPSMRTNGVSPFSPPAHQEHDLLGDDTPPHSATLPQHTGNVLQAQMTGAQLQQTAFVASSPPHPRPSGNYDPFGSSSPPRNLLDNDDDGSPSAPLYDQSAEIGNVQNQLNSTNRSVETTKAARNSVEQTLTNQAGQLSALQTQLSSAKAAYETETKLLSTLRERLSVQTADMQKTREDLIRAESDLSAVRVEKAEVEGSFLRDKEDARELHRKMVEAGQQAETMRLEVEKAKKEAKQQKGLLAIARKQLSTKELERAKAEKELEDANAEAAEAAREREEAEAELEKISSFPPIIMERNPSTGGDSLNFAASYALPVTPDISSPAAMSPNMTGKSNNPFERLAKSGHSTPRSQSPFLPANSPLPPPPAAEVPLAASSDDPFGFSDALAAEVPAVPQKGPATESADVETLTFEAVPAEIPISPPSNNPAPLATHSPTGNSENEHFTTPPDTAAGPSRVTSPTLQLPDLGVSTMFPDLDSQFSPLESTLPGHFPLSPEYHESSGETDLASQLKELDVNESDSDSDDDEVPLAELKAKVPNDNAAPTTIAFPTSDVAPTIPFDDAFGQLMDTSPPPPEQTTPALESSKDAFGATVTQTTYTQDPNAQASGVNAFDEAMGKIPSGSASAAPQLTFETAFDDNFDFASAKFPPAPATNVNGKTPVISPTTNQTNGFDSIFATSNNKQTTAPPAGDSHGQPSFEDTFASTLPALAPQVAASPNTQTNHGISFDDAFSGLELAQTLKPDSPFGSLPSRTSAVLSRPGDLNATRRPMSTISPPASPRSASSPTRMSSIGPASPPPRQWSPPPRVSSPKPRHSTSSKESQERPKDPPPRHSKLSIRLPFGRKKKQDNLPPPPPPPAQFLTPPIEEPSRTMTPAVDDDVESVKQLCGMGFSRSQAVDALEAHGYDFQRALNSLLTASER